jgi:hypothetical protein
VQKREILISLRSLNFLFILQIINEEAEVHLVAVDLLEQALLELLEKE